MLSENCLSCLQFSISITPALDNVIATALAFIGGNALIATVQD